MEWAGAVNRRIVTMARSTHSRTQEQGATRAPDPCDLPDCVCGSLRMVTRAVTQIYDDAMRPSGLRVTQYSLLSRLNRLGPVSAASLVDSLHADQTTLARALKVLENDGLIRRVKQADQRIRMIELTPEGGKRLAQARRLWADAQACTVGLIGQQQWHDLRARLGGMLNALGPVQKGQ